jgi:hypothetical protein
MGHECSDSTLPRCQRDSARGISTPCGPERKDVEALHSAQQESLACASDVRGPTDGWCKEKAGAVARGLELGIIGLVSFHALHGVSST